MLIDITKKINESTFIYPDDPKTIIKSLYEMEKDGFRLTELTIGLHTSTHIDFPSHFLKNGKTSSDYYDINYFLGKVLIVGLSDFPVELDVEIDSIFIKTDNNSETFLQNYKSINKEQLNFLINNKLKFIGTDFYTIEPYNSDDFSFHKNLLKNNILIIENLEISNIETGIYEYFIFPMKIDAVEASICRVAIRKTNNIC